MTCLQTFCPSDETRHFDPHCSLCFPKSLVIRLLNEFHSYTYSSSSKSREHFCWKDRNCSRWSLGSTETLTSPLEVQRMRFKPGSILTTASFRSSVLPNNKIQEICLFTLANKSLFVALDLLVQGKSQGLLPTIGPTSEEKVVRNKLQFHLILQLDHLVEKWRTWIEDPWQGLNPSEKYVWPTLRTDISHFTKHWEAHSLNL